MLSCDAVLECSDKRIKHADKMVEPYGNENSQYEETNASADEGRFYLHHMMDVYENYSVTNECEENGADESRGCLPLGFPRSDCMFDDDLERMSHLNPIQ